MHTIQDIQTLEDRISHSQKISIITHVNPDGDAIGSTTGLHHFLKSIGKKSVILLPSTLAQNLNYLKETDDLLVYAHSESEDYKIREQISTSDLIICCDFNSISRSGKMEELLRSAQCYKILIDHHPGPAVEEFDLVFSAPQMSSTCELLYSLLKQTRAFARDSSVLSHNCLMGIATGLITDTNNFCNSSTAGTFRMAAEMLEAGISLEEIKRRTFGGYSEHRMRLQGELLLNQMHLMPEIGAAYIILTKELQDRFDYQTGDTEGVVNMPLNIQGIQISAFFTESDENIRASFRSVEPVSANAFSRKYFNGGGHERAAGGRSTLKIEEIEEYFRRSITEYVHSLEQK